jgi:hypothetical protein
MPPRCLSVCRAAGLHGSILRAGALWLVGVCGAELQPAPWTDALGLVVQHVSHADVVVSWGRQAGRQAGRRAGRQAGRQKRRGGRRGTIV